MCTSTNDGSCSSPFLLSCMNFMVCYWLMMEKFVVRAREVNIRLFYKVLQRLIRLLALLVTGAYTHSTVHCMPSLGLDIFSVRATVSSCIQQSKFWVPFSSPFKKGQPWFTSYFSSISRADPNKPSMEEV